MREMVIEYRGELIPVETVDEIGGDLNELYDFDDYLLRDSDGRDYLRRTRMMKMPPNAEDLYDKKIFGALRNDESDDAKLEMRRLHAWRRQLTKPRTTIKRITEKTALLWCIHQFNDETIKARMREAVIATFGKEAGAL